MHHALYTLLSALPPPIIILFTFALYFNYFKTKFVNICQSYKFFLPPMVIVTKTALTLQTILNNVLNIHFLIGHNLFQNL